jgi:hypothetical protein
VVPVNKDPDGMTVLVKYVKAIAEEIAMLKDPFAGPEVAP